MADRFSHKFEKKTTCEKLTNLARGLLSGIPSADAAPKHQEVHRETIHHFHSCSTELTDGYFHANHASNYLPVKAKLPMDKAKTLQQIRIALNGEVNLKPEYMRGL